MENKINFKDHMEGLPDFPSWEQNPENYLVEDHDGDLYYHRGSWDDYRNDAANYKKKIEDAESARKEIIYTNEVYDEISDDLDYETKRKMGVKLLDWQHIASMFHFGHLKEYAKTEESLNERIDYRKEYDAKYVSSAGRYDDPYILYEKRRQISEYDRSDDELEFSVQRGDKLLAYFTAKGEDVYGIDGQRLNNDTPYEKAYREVFGRDFEE